MNIKKHYINLSLFTAISTTFIGCGNEPKLPDETIKEIESLVSQNQYLKAIKQYEKILVTLPKNIEIQKKLKSTKELYVQTSLDSIKENYQRLLVHSIQEINKNIDMYKKLNPYLTSKTQANYDNLNKYFNNERQIVKDKILLIDKELTNAINSNLYDDAMKYVVKIGKYDSRLLNSDKIRLVNNKLDQYYFKVITSFLDSDKLQSAKEYYTKYLNYGTNKNQLKELEQKIQQYSVIDNKIKKSYQLLLESRVDEVFETIKVIYSYDIKNPILIKRLKQLNQKITKVYLNMSSDYLEAHNLFDAYATLVKVISLNKNVKHTKIAKKVLEELYKKAKIYADSRFSGNAYAIYTYIQKIDPNYKSVFVLHRELKDALIKSNILKIAASKFITPANEGSSGTRFTASLTSKLFKDKPKDLKVIERNRLQLILDELKLSETGNIESLAQRGKIKGLDAFIFGDVIESSVETQRRESSEQAMVTIGTRKINNSKFMMYMMSSDLDKKRWKELPKEFIEEPVTQLISYKKGKIKKTSNLIVSIRIVDIAKGDIIAAKTFEEKNTLEDKFNDGVQLANIVNDSEDILSDKTILNKLQEKMISNISAFILDQFKYREAIHLDKAEFYIQRREFDKAMEYIINAEIIESIKNESVSSVIKDKKYDLFKEIIK
ncbi:MAG: CsgG/HfaB family protein [Campylobacterota bacterium]|nr:CsgG/HfaB family protein [Campylobacterota bacterium]